MSGIGAAIDRVDGNVKVTGAARYAAEFQLPNLAYGVVVLARVPSGRIAGIDTADAEHAPGVLHVMTCRNAPRVRGEVSTSPAGIERGLLLMQDDEIRYDGQPVALVVAETWEQAADAASRVNITFDQRPAITTMDQALDHAFLLKPGHESRRGDPDKALAEAPVRIEQVYTTPVETHAQMEPHAAIAHWEGDALTLYDATQGVFEARRKLAYAFDVPEASVRVITQFVGGGFGGKGSVWEHEILAAMAARELHQPVKVVLARPDMFRTAGYRSGTRQSFSIGAGEDGRLLAISHDTIGQVAMFDEFVEQAGSPTGMLYACPNVYIANRITRVNAGAGTFTRAPGESVGSFAQESALDELAYATGLDPIELRLRNYAETDPMTGLPWSSKHLRDCYATGAERFGWERRTPEPRSMRQGDVLIGLGMATATYPVHSSSASGLVRVISDGTALAQSGSQDLGTGMYTVMTQVAADALGLPPDRVRAELGDTALPYAPTSGGSVSAGSVGSAIHNAAMEVRRKLAEMAVQNEKSPLHGCALDDIDVEDGRLFLRSYPSRGEAYREVLKREGLNEVEARAEGQYGSGADEQYAMHGFGAQFAEVHVDSDLGEVRLKRFTGVFSAGRLLNAKVGRGQLLGGIVWGISMALHEDTIADRNRGRIMNANLADYLVPVNADVPDVDVVHLDEDDPHVSPLSTKGIGELGITGVAAAIANAVYHATGKRIRDLPITPEKLLANSGV